MVTSEDVPRAAVLVRAPQHLEMPSLSSTLAGVAVRRAAVLVRVPHHLEVPCLGSSAAGATVPWAVARAEPAQRTYCPFPAAAPHAAAVCAHCRLSTSSSRTSTQPTDAARPIMIGKSNTKPVTLVHENIVSVRVRRKAVRHLSCAG
eukprot:CAMPEP_0179847218 /NCGR_PEP_ID=MMETSP0982-20121206/5965_1 /TAXON_ID=483367 /ORGANISM="non described non described, Strain CCMP 2436" /LENGTH=146 /DNA_ID=CAMNT_0021732387 /DNA_START=140 /DNA_END=577 /DNA_ORIENTATION=+